MREIKFRAWDGERLKKVWSMSWIDEEMDSVGTPEYSGPAEDFILMQCTGLKDKNGREIYEGDVVKEKFDDEYDVGKVIFKDGAFWVEFKPDEELLLGCDSEETEIIGNIYENPELLGDAK